MNVRLSTIILYVKDVQLLKIFYVENFNLKVIEEDPVWALLDAGGIYIGLHKIGDQYLEEIEADHIFDNNTKIVFDIDMDIKDAKNDLVSKNVRMRDIKTFQDYPFWLCDGTDPEGNVFQLRRKK
jgi:hypothetical protein